MVILALAIWPSAATVKRLGERERRRVVLQRRCLRCGYDLSMTPMNSPCPECGLAAERSLVAHVHPDDCPPRWVWSIAIATLMLLLAYVVFAGVFILAAVMIG